MVQEIDELNQEQPSRNVRSSGATIRGSGNGEVYSYLGRSSLASRVECLLGYRASCGVEGRGSMITKAHERMAEGGQRSLRRSQAENPIDKPDSRSMGS